MKLTVHGTNSGYTHGACRCKLCRGAHADYQHAFYLKAGRPSRAKHKLPEKPLGRWARAEKPAAESAARLASFFDRLKRS